jgi:hypothetical protein
VLDLCLRGVSQITSLAGIIRVSPQSHGEYFDNLFPDHGTGGSIMVKALCHKVMGLRPDEVDTFFQFT